MGTAPGIEGAIAVHTRSVPRIDSPPPKSSTGPGCEVVSRLRDSPFCNSTRASGSSEVAERAGADRAPEFPLERVEVQPEGRPAGDGAARRRGARRGVRRGGGRAGRSTSARASRSGGRRRRGRARGTARPAARRRPGRRSGGPGGAAPGAGRTAAGSRGRAGSATRASTSSASSSSSAMSSRSWSAVRASVRATPGPSSSSRSGRIVRRTRTRVKDGSVLCGSSHTVRPSTWQAVTVSSRRTSRSGRAKSSNPRRMPARERPPEPRVRPSRTVSAWSSRVWPSSTTAAESRSATSSRTA